MCFKKWVIKAAERISEISQNKSKKQNISLRFRPSVRLSLYEDANSTGRVLVKFQFYYL